MKRILSRSPRLQLVSRGFTLVELVVVVFIIAVLAALTVVAYGNFTGQARDKAVLSDLDHLDTLETNLEIHNNGAPEVWYSGSGADATLGFTPSPGDLIDIVANSTNTGYCIRGWNPSSASYQTINSVAIKENPAGTCAANPPSAAAQAANTYIPGPNGGNVTTLVSGLNYPTNMVVDPISGNLDVISGGSNKIWYVTPAGVVTLFASGFPGYSTWGISAIANGTLYYTDTYGESIDQITTAGVATVFAGGSYGSTDGVGTAAKFSRIIDVVSDSSGNLYAADLDNNTIRKITTPGAVVTTLAGIPGSSGSANGPGASATFTAPYGLSVDSAGNVYVADSGNNLIRKITSTGVVSTLAGSGASGSTNGAGSGASFNDPCNTAVDGSGNVYVLDCNNNLVREITPSGVVSTLAGSGASGSTNGNGTSASFSGLSGIVVTSSGIVYVSEYGNSDIRKIQ